MTTLAAGGGPLASVSDNSKQQAERFARLVTAWLYCFPILWLTGLAGFWWLALTVPAIALLGSARFTSASRAATGVGVAILISVPVGVTTFGFELSRVLAVTGNVAVWLVVAALLTAAERVNIRARLAPAIMTVGAFQGLAILLAMHSNLMLKFPLLQSKADSLPGSTGDFATNSLYYLDWLDGAAYRSSGVMANPTWAGAFGALSCLAALTYRKHSPLLLILRAAALGGGVVAIELSLSRSTTVALACASVVGIIVTLRPKHPQAFFTAVTFGACGAAAIFLAYSTEIWSAINDLNSERAASLETRSEIYSTTWSFIADLEVPVIGYGIKPKIEGLVASVASHSTYLGLLFRGGIVGLVAFLALLAILARKVLSAGSGLGTAVLVFIAMWCLVEDFDPGHLVPLGLIFCVPPKQDSPIPERSERLERPRPLASAARRKNVAR